MDATQGRAQGYHARMGWKKALLRAMVRGAIALVLASAISAEAGAQQSNVAPSLVFDKVTVVDVEQGKLVPGQRVVIAGNRIQAVGAVRSVKMPTGAQVVEAQGKYLIPGLWDMHIHPHKQVDLLYPLFIANGVTGFRDAWSYVPLQTMTQWRREILAGTRVGPPRQLLSGVAFDERDQCMQTNLTAHICVAVGDSANARRLVGLLKAAGADMIKMYDLSKEMYFFLAAEARRLGMSFGGHTAAIVGKKAASAVEASDSGALIVDHVGHCEDLDPAHASAELCPSVAARLRQNGTWVMPGYTMGFNNGSKSGTGPYPWAVWDRINKRSSEFWAGMPARFSGNWLRDSILADGRHTPGTGLPRDSLGVMYLLQRAGVPIVAGTDVALEFGYREVAGFALHAELAMYVTEGLTPLNALQSATLNPAKMLRATDSLGTVAPGKLADLVLLDADPLADITNTTTVRAVVANGRYFDRAALDKLLAEIQAKAKGSP